jgi:hypothetical protein
MNIPSPSTAAEFLRLAIVYVHLIACCVAIGMVLISDLKMIKQLISQESANSHHDRRHLHELQTIIFIALALLWVSGAGIVGVDFYHKGAVYFTNPKLQAKILIVLILTLNGVVLHHKVLPWLQRAGSLLKLSFGQAMFAIFSGTLSGVSWFYAAMLGVGRPLAWKYSLLELMAAYPLLIMGGFFSMLSLITWCKFRISTTKHIDFSPTHIFEHKKKMLHTS